MQNAYTCKPQKELPSINLLMATCESCKGITIKAGTWIHHCKSHGAECSPRCKKLLESAGASEWRLAALSGLSDSAVRWHFFFACTIYIIKLKRYDSLVDAKLYSSALFANILTILGDVPHASQIFYSSRRYMHQIETSMHFPVKHQLDPFYFQTRKVTKESSPGEADESPVGIFVIMMFYH